MVMGVMEAKPDGSCQAFMLTGIPMSTPSLFPFASLLTAQHSRHASQSRIHTSRRNSQCRILHVHMDRLLTNIINPDPR